MRWRRLARSAESPAIGPAGVASVRSSLQLRCSKDKLDARLVVRLHAVCRCDNFVVCPGWQEESCLVRSAFAADVEPCCSAGVAQLVEHLICNQRVGGSNPFASSRIVNRERAARRSRSKPNETRSSSRELIPASFLNRKPRAEVGPRDLCGVSPGLLSVVWHAVFFDSRDWQFRANGDAGLSGSR